MSKELFSRLSRRGKRRAVAVVAVESVIYTAIFAGIGYACCLAVYALQTLCGVA